MDSFGNGPLKVFPIFFFFLLNPCLPCPPPTFTPSEARTNENPQRQNASASQFCLVLGRTAVLSSLEALGVEGCCSLKVLLSPAHKKSGWNTSTKLTRSIPRSSSRKNAVAPKATVKMSDHPQRVQPSSHSRRGPSQLATPTEFSKALGWDTGDKVPYAAGDLSSLHSNSHAISVRRQGRTPPENSRFRAWPWLSGEE